MTNKHAKSGSGCHDYEYGHAGCCCCERDLDLSAGPSSISAQFGNLVLYFHFCSECFPFLEGLGTTGRDLAVSFAMDKGMAALPNHPNIAMVTSLALAAHGGDLVSAYEIGVDLPRVVHDAIMAGEAEITFVPDLLGTP